MDTGLFQSQDICMGPMLLSLTTTLSVGISLQLKCCVQAHLKRPEVPVVDPYYRGIDPEGCFEFREVMDLKEHRKPQLMSEMEKLFRLFQLKDRSDEQDSVRRSARASYIWYSSKMKSFLNTGHDTIFLTSSRIQARPKKSSVAQTRHRPSSLHRQKLSPCG
jgi:hypothetical protein